MLYAVQTRDAVLEWPWEATHGGKFVLRVGTELFLRQSWSAIKKKNVSSSHRPRRQFWLSCTNLVFYIRRLRVELYSDKFPERLFQERFALSGAILDHFFRDETRRGRLERPPPPGRLPTQAFIACVRQVRMARHEFLVCHPIWLFVRC